MRTFNIVFVLAAFFVASFNVLPVAQAKTHGKVSSDDAPAATSRHSQKKAAAPKAASPVATADPDAEQATGHKAKRAKVKSREDDSDSEPAPKLKRSNKRTSADRQPAEDRERPARQGRQASVRQLRAYQVPIRKATGHRSSDYPIPESEPSTAEAKVEPASLRTERTTKFPPTRALASPTGDASPLHGSVESLLRQNQKTEADNLERIEDEDDLADRIARKMLVPLPISAALTVNASLPVNHRYCRSWTAAFLADLARTHAAEFHHPLYVSSAVRTVDYQRRLTKINGNAAAAEGEYASPHLTGATIDIAKQGMNSQELIWMRSHLLEIQDAGNIDVEEEFRQACFHITVYKSYLQPDSTLKAGQRQAKKQNYSLFPPAASAESATQEK